MMRVRLIKKFYCVVIVFLVSIKHVAAHIYTDTTKLLASLPIKKPSEFKINFEPNNVKYPESLKDERDQSLAYIEKFSDKKRDYLLHIYEQGKEYFPKVSAVLKQYQLPEELKVLIAIESGFNGNAVSKAGAVGYWQMMEQVGKAYGLHITASRNKHSGKIKYIDDRRNFNKSTLAAAKFFRDCQEDMNNDLLLMVASYNCGGGRVRSSIKKSGNPDAGFWDIKKFLPAETRNYVMNFIALNVIFENFEKYVNGDLLFLPGTVINIPETSEVYDTSVPDNSPAVD